MRLLSACTVWLLLASCCGVSGGQESALADSIHRRDAAAWEAALKIWSWAEPGYQEKKSSTLLADMLEAAGFEVERGLAEMPTAFTATFGTQPPVIAILGEFDALPGLSQQAVPVPKPVQAGGYGHGCGHHLFGVASASAAIALAEQIEAGQITGTVRFYGCPAEEGGSAKVFLVRRGAFADCAAALHWHPSSRNAAGDKSSLARNAVKFRFIGKAAHAAGAPEQGRSALDAVELTNHAAQLLREHTPAGTRIHHVITEGGLAPNVVPNFAEVYYYVRHPNSDVVRDLYRRLVLCARAGALATETKLNIKFEGGILEILPNDVLSQLAMKNLQALNDLEYSERDVQFATRLQQTLAKPAPLDSIQVVVDVSGNRRDGFDRRRRCFVGGSHHRIQHRVLCSRDSRSLLASGSFRSEGPGPAGHEPGGSGVGQDRLGPVFEPGATDGGAGRTRPAVGASQLPAADAAGHATSARLPAAIAGTVSAPEIPRAASPRDHREWEVMSETVTNPKRLRRHPPEPGAADAPWRAGFAVRRSGRRPRLGR